MLLMGLSCLAENQQSSRLQAAAPWVAMATQLQLAPNYKETSLVPSWAAPYAKATWDIKRQQRGPRSQMLPFHVSDPQPGFNGT